MTEFLNERVVAHQQRRRSRASIAVLATGNAAFVISSRLRRAQFASLSFFDSAERVLNGSENDSYSAVVSVVTPELLSRAALHSFDENGLRILGVVGNRRHRTWASLLPLFETVWMFAPSSSYLSALRGYETRGHQQVSD